MARNDATEERGSAIKATMARYDNRPDECTLHPVSPRAGKRTTEWITAERGTYLYLALWR